MRHAFLPGRATDLVLTILERIISQSSSPVQVYRHKLSPHELPKQIVGTNLKVAATII